MMSVSPFAPTHVVPDAGMPAWDAPDPQRPVATQLDARLAVEVIEQRADGWAHIRCSNDWSAWVDGRLLIPSGTRAPAPPAPPPAPPFAPAPTYRLEPTRPTPVVAQPVAAPTWTPTHAVPNAGMPAWDAPDAARASVSRLEAGMPVQLLEQRADGWAHISCSNGWSAWVDGRLLATSPAPGSRAPVRPRPAAGGGISWLPGVDPFVAGGAALVLAGSFVSWLSRGAFSASAWDISLNFLITGKGTLSGFKAGVVLLAVVVVAIPALSHQPLPTWVVPLVGAVSSAVAVAALLRGLGITPSLDPGIGLFMTLAGGILLLLRSLPQLMNTR
jgi:hypothetical protein